MGVLGVEIFLFVRMKLKHLQYCHLPILQIPHLFKATGEIIRLLKIENFNIIFKNILQIKTDFSGEYFCG